MIKVLFTAINRAMPCMKKAKTAVVVNDDEKLVTPRMAQLFAERQVRVELTAANSKGLIKPPISKRLLLVPRSAIPRTALLPTKDEDATPLIKNPPMQAIDTLPWMVVAPVEDAVATAMLLLLLEDDPDTEDHEDTLDH